MNEIESSIEELSSYDDPQVIALELINQIQDLLFGLFRPWNAYQLAIALIVFLIATLLSHLIRNQLRSWMQAREAWPIWRTPLMALFQNRLRSLLFIILIYIVISFMREITWPSRSYLLGVIGQIAFIWYTIAILTSLISNSFARTAVSYVGWTWGTLSVLNLSGPIQTLLDSAAISLGETRISIWLIIQAFLTLVILFVGARFVSTTGADRIRKNKDISPSLQVLIIKFTQVVLYSAVFIIGLRTVGFDLTGLAFLSGAIGVGLGFGLQKVVSNLVSGVIILLDKSIKPGDVISLGDTFGWIESLGARYVSVVTRDGREYLIPNEDLITGQVVNWSHSNNFVRLDLLFGTSYEDDPILVRELAIKAALTVDRVLKDRTPVCHIINFGDSSIDYMLRFWITDPAAGLTNIKGDVYLALWQTFAEHKVTIPFPRNEVRILEPNRPQDFLK